LYQRGRCIEECASVGLYTAKECDEYCKEYAERVPDKGENDCGVGGDEDCPYIEEHG
jgi:hypothetical protein